MSCLSYETVRPAIYDVVLKAKLSRSDESEKALDIIFGSIYFDLNYVYDFGGSLDMLRSVIMNGKPLVSTYEGISEKIEKDIEKTVEVLTE